MVKKWIIITTIMILLIVGCILEYRFVNNSFKELEGRLETYQTMLDTDEEHIDTDTNIEYIEMVHKKWHKRLKGLKALIWHTGTKDIEIGLARIKTYTKENDYTEALAELTSLIDYVEHYAKDFTVSLENLL